MTNTHKTYHHSLKRRGARTYKTFAYEVASLKRIAEAQKDDGDTSTGACCAACGLECALAPEERTTCQKCYVVHYCSSQCMRWDWSSGGHEDECPKKPPRKRIDFLRFQSSRRPSTSSHSTLSTSGGSTCNACGSDCRVVGTERMTCPDCEGTHYCGADCMDWGWEKGGHAQDCQRSQTTRTQMLTDFLIQQHEQQEKQQEQAPQRYAHTPDDCTIEEESVQYTEYTEEEVDSYTIQEESVQQTEYFEEDTQTLDDYTVQDEAQTLDDCTTQEESVQHTEYIEKTSDAEVLVPLQSNSARVGPKNGAIYKEGETVPDEEEEEIFYEKGEDDNEQGEEADAVETEVEILQTNHCGRLIAVYGAPYCRDTPDSGARAACRRAYGPTPDIPETVVTSNQQQEQEQQKYPMDIRRYCLQQEPSIPVYLEPSEAADLNTPIPARSAYRKPTPLVRSSSNNCTIGAIGRDQGVEQQQPSPSAFYSLSTGIFFSRCQESSRLAPGASSRRYVSKRRFRAGYCPCDLCYQEHKGNQL